MGTQKKKKRWENREFSRRVINASNLLRLLAFRIDFPFRYSRHLKCKSYNRVYRTLVLKHENQLDRDFAFPELVHFGPFK